MARAVAATKARTAGEVGSRPSVTSPTRMAIISSMAALSPAAALSRMAARRRLLTLMRGARSSMRRR